MTWEERYHKTQEQLEEIRSQRPYEVSCKRCGKHLNIQEHGEVHLDEDYMFVLTKHDGIRAQFYLCLQCKDWFNIEVDSYKNWPHHMT